MRQLRIYATASDILTLKVLEFWRAREDLNPRPVVRGRLMRILEPDQSAITWPSLDNEAIAKAIETALGVTTRKAAEKLAWC
jgi:hypothetical protein